MKSCFLIGLIIFLNFKSLCQLAPGLTCAEAGCSTSGSYTNSTGIPSMGNWGCLGSTPNAGWMSFGISTSGSVHLLLTQTNPAGTLIDVDFALYGPFSSASAGCPIDANTPQVDCSYSASGTEIIDITSALVGEVYILLVTNFNGGSGTISIQSNIPDNPTGQVDCSVNFSFTTTTTPTLCNEPTGSVTINPSGGFEPYTYTITPPAGIPITSSTPTFNDLTPGTYSVSVASSINPTTGLVINPVTGTFTIVNQAPNSTVSYTPISCPGGSNGTATVISSPLSAASTYLWSNGQTTPTITGLIVGTYSCLVQAAPGCLENLSVNVTQIPFLNLVISNQQDITCNSANNGIATITVTQGTAPYTYSWNTSSSISNTASNLIPGTNIFTVTDANFCTETIPVILTEPNPLAITFVSPDAMICSESTIDLSAVGTGGSTPNTYTFTWTENGIPIGNGSTINVDPINTGNIYCVTLSELCGSPIPPQQCLTITFPTPIIPNAITADPKQCLPGNFIFSNTSINGVEIATMEYTFSNGFDFTSSDLNPLSATFPYAGVFDLGLTVTSIYGCVYTAQLPSIIEVTSLPIAGFTISKNPATWFETTIQTNDISVGNISSYVWSSVGASNLTSNGNNAFISYPEGITGNYEISLKVTDSEGCIDSTILTMEIVPDIIFYAPNSFTPDDDEHNQSWFFYIEGIDFANFNLQIYNRWGRVIWETNDVKAKWDGYYNGLKVQAGSYPWKASFKALDNDDKQERNGLINVIR